MPEGTLEIHLGKINRPFKIKLNAKTEKEGIIKVLVYDSRKGKLGYWTKETDGLIGETILTGDHIDEIIRWGDKEYLQPAENSLNLILKIDLKLASVYAYDIVY